MSWIVGFIAKSALMQSPIGAFLKMIPKQVWIVLAVALAIWLGVRWHAHQVKKVYQSGYDHAVADIRDAEAKKVAPLKAAKSVADAKNVATNEEVRKTHDAQNARVDGNLADLLSMYAAAESRPGTQSDAGVSSAARGAGPVRAKAPADDGLAQGASGYPSDELLVAVPAKQLAVRSAICDRDYTALTAWEDAYLGWEQNYKDWLAQVHKIER
jgi:hypothetical protein